MLLRGQQNKASNAACRAKLGRLPLNITINQKILKYILYENLSLSNLFKFHRFYILQW